MANDDEIRILVSRSAANRIASNLSRRRFLGLSAGAAVTAALAACGSSKSGTTGTTGGASGTTGAPGDTTGTTAAPVPTGSGKPFNLYTWAEYDDPDLMASYGKINIDIYDSVEQAIQKLTTAKGTSGYDLIVPTGPYIPQMVKDDLLEPLDLSRIPNFSNIDPIYTNQSWDPGNKYSVCKDWGSTGWIYDTSIVKTEIKTWADFIKVTQTEASGQTSLLDTPTEGVCGIYFWANGIPWTTEKKEDLDACEKFAVDEFAQHIKAFDSYPGINLTQGNYALSEVWNGDARQGLIKVEEAGGDPAQYKWGLGAPVTELWMDNWSIIKGAKNIDAAYDFINFILDAANSVKDLEFHGYNTGIKGVLDLVPKDLKYPEMIFFDDAQVKTMDAGAINSAQDRLVEIYDKAKAKAGG